jgi:hypothetical protein
MIVEEILQHKNSSLVRTISFDYQQTLLPIIEYEKTSIA